jgi:hypothetical protein
MFSYLSLLVAETLLIQHSLSPLSLPKVRSCCRLSRKFTPTLWWVNTNKQTHPLKALSTRAQFWNSLKLINSVSEGARLGWESINYNHQSDWWSQYKKHWAPHHALRAVGRVAANPLAFHLSLLPDWKNLHSAHTNISSAVKPFMHAEFAIKWNVESPNCT